MDSAPLLRLVSALLCASLVSACASRESDRPQVAADGSPSTDYLVLLNQTIAENLKYPWAAQREKQEGDVVIRIHELRDGTVTSTEVVKACPYEELNQEGINVIKRIGKMPKVPGNIFPQAPSFIFTMPIQFRLHPR